MKELCQRYPKPTETWTTLNFAKEAFNCPTDSFASLEAQLDTIAKDFNVDLDYLRSLCCVNNLVDETLEFGFLE